MASWSTWSAVLPLVGFFILPWLIYWDALWCGWVSDDLAGIQQYDGTLQRPLSWHNCFKKFRYEYGKRPNPNPAWKEQKQAPFVPSSAAHHRLNLWVLSGIGPLLYCFLGTWLPAPTAFFATLLFLVHPLGCQTVAWISGIGYVMALFFMLVGLNVGHLLVTQGWLTHPTTVLWAMLLYGLCQWMAVEAQFATVGATIILWWLHWYPLAIVAGGCGMYQCLHTLKEAVVLRRKIFKEQQMASSTTFHPRKLVVMLKTLAYDLKLACFPKRLGLYHTFNYHYPLPYVESEDAYFWAGVVSLLGLGGGIVWGPPVVQFACLWFLAFFFVFSNAITANQFVVDRYVWIPSLGVCVLVAAYAPLWLIWLVVGIALMRTWAHIPTYLNEIQFYLSNIWNFPSSEIAVGNLGVTQLARGQVGAAMETWTTGIQMNPEYDVNWYNLSSLFRSRGPLNPNYLPIFHMLLPQPWLQSIFQQDASRAHLHLARYCLDKAIHARTCHFPEPWKRELEHLTAELSRPAGAPPILLPLVTPVLPGALS